ncbi:alpha/beta hydrolase family protein [Nakamurella antarctica]|nr:alpha/beta hydrolase [Nakamurella antarctica]
MSGAIATVALLTLVAGCVATGATYPGATPAPTDIRSAASSLADPHSAAVSSSGAPEASPAEAPASGTDAISEAKALSVDSSGVDDSPAAAGDSAADSGNAVAESMVWVPAGDHRVPGTLALPAVPTEHLLPVVLLLHGDMSSRNENGDLFTRLAADLAGRGIASLRIDFAGSGDSEQSGMALDYPGMVTDATASLTYLKDDSRIDPNRVAVLGLSRGGSIAATLAGTVPGVAALAEWSGAVYNGFDEDPDGHDQARTDGYATVGGDTNPFPLSLNWFDSIEQSHPLDDVAGYTGPVLAVTGSADTVVPPVASDVLVQTLASTDVTRYVIDGADHEYDATTDDQTHAEEALAVTTHWFASRLTGSPTS